VKALLFFCVFLFLNTGCNHTKPAFNTPSFPFSERELAQTSVSEMTEEISSFLFEKNCDQSLSCHILFDQHLKNDSQKCLVPAGYVSKHYPKTSGKIVGKSIYRGFVPGKYSYTFQGRRDRLEIKVFVYFKNHKRYTNSELEIMRDDLKRAEVFWEKNNTFTDYKVDFVFELTLDPQKADVSPYLIKRKIRGPYFKYWSLKWAEAGSEIVTHELGHVLGLGDEYEQPKCLRKSLMCSKSKAARPQKHHYYTFLRRLFCS